MAGMQEKVRAVLAGAETSLGQAVAATRPLDVEMEAVASEEFPAEDPQAIREMLRSFRPDVVINTAMPFDPDAGPDADHDAMLAAATAWARGASATKARLIQPSSVAVFAAQGFRAREAGERPDATDDFGRALLDVEREVTRRMGDAALILRAGRLHAPVGDNRLTRDLEALRSGDFEPPARGPSASVVSAWSLAEFIWQASRMGRAHGVLHWSDDSRVSPWDWLTTLARRARALGLLDQDPEVEPAPAAAGQRAWQVLDLERTRRLMFLNPRPWEAALEDNLRRLQGGPENARDAGRSHGQAQA